MSVPNDCSALGCEVGVGSIELELKKLWEADEARTNASLINFAVYSENASSLTKNSEIVREITREHACRAILIGVDRQQPVVSTRAWITAHCNLANGNKTVCCEQLAFHLSGHVNGRLSNTVFAHLHSDLPLIFWWQGELTDRFCAPLYSWVDRLVVDSSDWANPSEQFGRLCEAVSQKKLVVQDLSWTRTYHLRLSIAALFDDPIAQSAIPAIKKIKIITSEKARISGLQLLAWIAVQCNWATAQELVALENTAGGYHFEHQHGGLVEAEVQTDGSCAAIARVEIDAGDVKIVITHETDEQFLHLHMSMNGHVIEQSAPADSSQIVGLVRDQLSRGGKNSLFRKVYPLFIEMLNA